MEQTVDEHWIIFMSGIFSLENNGMEIRGNVCKRKWFFPIEKEHEIYSNV